MKLSFIVAIDENNGMGFENKLPWHMPADLQHFKAKTINKPIIMGRKTYESIGRPLPHRENIIISRDKDFSVEGCHVYHSIDDALQSVAHHDEVVIIGGATLFSQLFDRVDILYLTRIHHEFEADVFFPAFDAKQWDVVDTIENKADAKNHYDYTFSLCKRLG